MSSFVTKMHAHTHTQRLIWPPVCFSSRSILDDFREAYYWLRLNTDQHARVMSWWDYGYQIAGMANRTTLVDNNTWNNSHIALVRRTGRRKRRSTAGSLTDSLWLALSGGQSHGIQWERGIWHHEAAGCGLCADHLRRGDRILGRRHQQVPVDGEDRRGRTSQRRAGESQHD